MASEQANNSENKELVVENRLRALYNLQKVMSQIDKIHVIRGELPKAIKDMEDEIAMLKTRLINNDAEIAVKEKEIAKHNHEIIDNNSAIDASTAAQNNVRNNREYEAISREIEYKKLEIAHSEKIIANNTKRIEEINAEREQTELRLNESLSTIEQKRAELNEIVAETRQDEERLLAEAKNLEQQIDEPRYLDAFKRIRKNARNGLAVVPIARAACGGCFNKIPPQRQLDIKLHKKIIVCEYCGRILVDDFFDMENQ